MDSLPFSGENNKQDNPTFSSKASASSNQRKDNQLGMPYGTAMNRLRKSVLFCLLEKHGENVCFRCKELISTSEELSIEHKQPWEANNIELFWDLDNIAFSHLKCNKPYRFNQNRGQRKTGEEGTAWCCGCQAFKPTENFNKDRYRWNDTRKYCRSCETQNNLKRKLDKKGPTM